MNTTVRALVLEQLAHWHVGHQYGIGCEALAKQVGCTEREVRHAVAALREDGIGVCGHPSTGYFMAATDAELNQTIDFHIKRAMHSLRQAARLKKIALPVLVGQLPMES
jgi:biotin operon repressor